VDIVIKYLCDWVEFVERNGGAEIVYEVLKTCPICVIKQCTVIKDMVLSRWRLKVWTGLGHK
jgi:hypothetical protein